MENSNDNGSKKDDLTGKEKALLAAGFVAMAPVAIGGTYWVTRQLAAVIGGTGYQFIRYLLGAR